MKTISAKKYAEKLISERGKTLAETKVNDEIENLSYHGSASSNFHQLRFFLNVLKYIK
jgi:hypothetical protein